MEVVGVEPTSPVLETGCLPVSETSLVRDGDRGCTGIRGFAGHCIALLPPRRCGSGNGGDRTLSCRATTCRASHYTTLPILFPSSVREVLTGLAPAYSALPRRRIAVYALAP
jgi:hypothetical protein